MNELCVERKIGLEEGTFVICGHCCQASFAGRTSPNIPAGIPKDEWGEVVDWKEKFLKSEFEGFGSVGIIIIE